jgi:small subunit ribosomal protein S20
MPQHKSAAKRVRQNEKRRVRNRVQRTRMRSMIKKLRLTNSGEEARALLPEVKAYLDRLAAKGIIHKNKAANYKSELEKKVNHLG